MITLQCKYKHRNQLTKPLSHQEAADHRKELKTLTPATEHLKKSQEVDYPTRIQIWALKNNMTWRTKALIKTKNREDTSKCKYF